MNICVASPSRNLASETFIRAHVERLPATVLHLYGDHFPVYVAPDRLLLPLLHTRVNALLASAMGKNLEFMNQFLMRKTPYVLRKRALRQLFARHRIRAVLAEYGPTGIALMDVCRSANVPLIVHFHGFDAYNRKTLAQLGDRYPELFRSAASVVVVSEDMRRRLESRGAPPDKITVNPCGVDPELFTQRDPSRSPPTFVAVGRLVPIKAPQLTLLAFAKVVAACPEARLIIVGDGPLRDSLEQLRVALGLKSSVELVGAQPHEQVRDVLAGARAFVQHSMKTADVEAEAFGLTLVEAGATGLPVVASRCGGMSDIVRHGETGFLVDQGDLDTMAEAMLSLARDGALAARLGAAGRSRVVAHYSMDDRIQTLWDTIRSAAQTASIR